MTSGHTIGLSAQSGDIPREQQNHGPRTLLELWQPPAPSTASRMPPLRGRGSFRGTIVDPVTNRVLVFESLLEKACVEILRVDPRVSEIFDQPPAVTYLDSAGKLRHHTFDFLARCHNGRRIAIAVKPEAKLEKSRIEQVVEAIRVQVGSRFADAFLVRTERHITRDKAYNARLILSSWHFRNKDHVQQITALVEDLKGAVKIADLMQRSGLEGHAMRAIACLIGDGVLRLARPGRIEPAALVVLAPASTRAPPELPAD